MVGLRSRPGRPCKHGVRGCADLVPPYDLRLTTPRVRPGSRRLPGRTRGKIIWRPLDSLTKLVHRPGKLAGVHSPNKHALGWHVPESTMLRTVSAGVVSRFPRPSQAQGVPPGQAPRIVQGHFAPGTQHFVHLSAQSKAFPSRLPAGASPAARRAAAARPGTCRRPRADLFAATSRGPAACR